MRIRDIFLVLIFYATIFIGSSFAASIDGTTSIHYTSTHQVFHNNEYATGYVKFNNGATIVGENIPMESKDAAAIFDILFPFSGALDLRQTGTLVLQGDLYLDTNCTLSGGGTIRGNGNTIFLNGDFTIPDNSVIHINSGTTIDGQGHNLIFGIRGRIFVDTNVTLTLCNMKIVPTYNDFSDPCIRLAAFKSQLSLKDVELALSQDFLFGQGQLFIHGDVDVTGTSAFIYRSTQHSCIASDSTFCFDKGTTFSVVPATMTDCRFDQWPTYTSNSFILMSDKTSNLCFNESSFFTTPTGCRFAKGTVKFENQCFLKSNGALGFSQSYMESSSDGASTDLYPACVAWSPDGSYLAVVNKVSNVLQIFDSTTFVQIGSSVITGSSPVSVSWSNTSTQLAVSNFGDNTIKVFNFDGASTPVLSVSKSTGTQPSCCAWSLYGKYIAVTNYGDDTVQVFNATTLSLIGSVSTGNFPSSVAWAPGDKLFAVTNSGSNTLQVFLFNGVGNPIQVASHATELSPSSVSWSQNGTFLSVVNSISNTTQIFSLDVDYNLELSYTESTNYTPLSTAWSLDGKYLALVNYTSDTLQFLTFFNQSYLNQIGSSVSPGIWSWSLSWSPDDRFLAMVFGAEDKLKVYAFNGSDTPTLYGEIGTGNYPRSASWSPVDNFIAVVNRDSDTLQVFEFDEMSTSTFVLVCDDVPVRGNSPFSVSWSPDGRFISVANFDSNSLSVFSFDKTRTSTIEYLDKVGTGVSYPCSVAWAWNGRFIAVGAEKTPNLDSTLQVFLFDESSTTTISLVDDVVDVPAPYLFGVSWSPDSNFITAGANIYSFDGVHAPNHIVSTSGNGGDWSPDGRFIAVVSYSDLNIFSFNGVSSLVRGCATVALDYQADVASWSHDGQFVAVVDFSMAGHIGSALQIFKMSDASFKHQVSEGISTKNGPTSLSWSPDNAHCAVSSGLENELQIFQLNNFSPAVQVGADISISSPNCVSWSPNGRFIAVCGGGFIKVFKFNEEGSSTEIASDSSFAGSVVWSPDGRFIAVTAGAFVWIYSFDEVSGLVETAGLMMSLSVVRLSWSPDGKFLAALRILGSGSGGSKYSLDVLRYTGDVYPVHGTDFGLVLVSSTGNIGGYGDLPSVSWSMDGKFIVVTNSDSIDNFMMFSFIESTGSLTQVVSKSIGKEITSALWSPDCRFVAVVDYWLNVLQIFSFNGANALSQVGFNVQTGSRPKLVVWSPDGRLLAVINSASDTLQIFSFDGASSPIQVGEDITTGGGVSGVSWSSDGRFIIVSNKTGNSMQAFKVNYVPNRSVQAISNGVVFGNSELGSDYDTAVSVLAGSKVYVDGKVNYDCVN